MVKVNVTDIYPLLCFTIVHTPLSYIKFSSVAFQYMRGQPYWLKHCTCFRQHAQVQKVHEL